jgi:general secretion pathway protein C
MSSLALKQADILRILQAGNVKYVILGINLLLVVWIAAQLATLTWGILAPAAEDSPVVSAARKVPAQQDQDRRLVGQIPGWHLMGVVTRKAAPATTAVPADAPETRLKLTLRGALASDDPANARAIIADPRGQDEQYSIGDTVPGNAELSEIYPDRVILKRGGRYETLRLPVDTQPAGNSTASRSTVQPARRVGATRNSPQQRLADVRQQLRQNPAGMQGLLRASVHTDDAGNMIGYALSPGNDPAMFAEMGLVDGDVVLQVNDMALSDPNNGARALQVLRSGEPVSVKLLRNGQEQLVTLDGL